MPQGEHRSPGATGTAALVDATGRGTYGARAWRAPGEPDHLPAGHRGRQQRPRDAHRRADAAAARVRLRHDRAGDRRGDLGVRVRARRRPVLPRPARRPLRQAARGHGPDGAVGGRGVRVRGGERPRLADRLAVRDRALLVGDDDARHGLRRRRRAGRDAAAGARAVRLGDDHRPGARAVRRRRAHRSLRLARGVHRPRRGVRARRGDARRRHARAVAHRAADRRCRSSRRCGTSRS